MPRTDSYKNEPGGLESPARRHLLITPGTTALDPIPRAIWCNTAGVVVIEDADGTQIDYTVTASQILPFRGVKVLATGTSGAAIGKTTTATVYSWD